MPLRLQLLEYSQDIIRPVQRRRLHGTGIAHITEIQVLGNNMDKVIVPAGDPHINGFVDGRRQYKTIVIIGMFSQEVYPARGSHDQRGGAKTTFESFYYPGSERVVLLGCYHISINLYLSICKCQNNG